MEGNFSMLYAFNLKPFENLPAEMQSGCRSSYRPGILSKNGLILISIIFACLALHVLRYRSFTYFLKYVSEFFFIIVIQEPDGTATGSGVINNLSHKNIRIFILAEEKFIPYPDFTGRVYKHIPQTMFLI